MQINWTGPRADFLYFCQITLETERLGPRRVESLRKEDEEWQRKAHAAVLSIQDLTVKFFETTTRAQKGKRINEAFPEKLLLDPNLRLSRAKLIS